MKNLSVTFDYLFGYLNYRYPDWLNAVGAAIFGAAVLYGAWHIGIFDPATYSAMH